MTQVTGT